MEDNKVIEGNKLIAEFMGAKFKSEDPFDNGNVHHYADFEPGNHPNQLIKSAGRRFEINDLIYHSSWDWLMPAWYRFRDLRTKGNIELDKHHDDFCGNIVRGISYGTIEDAFRELSSAIQWYNQVERNLD